MDVSQLLSAFCAPATKPTAESQFGIWLVCAAIQGPRLEFLLAQEVTAGFLGPDLFQSGELIL